MRLMFPEMMKTFSAAFVVLLAVAYAGVVNAQSVWAPSFATDAIVSFQLRQLGAKTPQTSYAIWIAGEIMPDTPSKVSSAITKLKEMGRIAVPQMVTSEPEFEVKLNSEGGSVDAAIEIGRMLRELDAIIVVEKDGQCLSSCVLILAGGTTRGMYGRIGIHRPYFETPNKSPTSAEVSAAMARVRAKIASYLSGMNVDRTLADDMIKTPPEKIHFLTPNDLNHYGLLGRDPVSEETSSLREASKYGLSRAEHIKRRDKAREVCDPLMHLPPWDAYDICKDQVLSGKR